MKKETLYELMSDISEDYVKQTKEDALKKPRVHWPRWTALAACLCLVMGIGVFMLMPSGSSVIGNGSHELLSSHREDFRPRELDPIFGAQLGEEVELTLFYRTLQNEWYLNRELTEISQALQSQPYYVDASSEKEYVYYFIENGQVMRGSSSSQTVPYAQGFYGLTQARIDGLLSGVDYEEYDIIQYAQYHLVFLWVRGAGEDRFISCQTDRFIDFEDGGVYTLDEVQDILTRFYEENTGFRGTVLYWYQHLKLRLHTLFMYKII